MSCEIWLKEVRRCRKAIVEACSETLYLMGSAAVEKRIMLTEHILLKACQNKGTATVF